MNNNRKIVNAISSKYVPKFGNQKKYIAIHYLGVVGQNHDLASDGCGAHFHIYWDGTIYQRCSLDAIVWAVGTAGYYTQKHPEARNSNTISIELCCKCDGNSSSAEDKKWYFTEETQEACIWLVQKLMEELDIPADHVLRHYDIVNKTCPAPYVHNNKYKTSWTWDEFKARLGASGETNIKGIQIEDSNVEAISKVVYGEAGIIRSYDALLGAAQCIYDMWKFGQFGKTVTEVMKKNYSAYESKETTDEAVQAVYDVFCQGKKRFPDAQVLQFRSFTKYSDGNGNMDKEKCADLLKKYEYIGKDARNNQWGNLYFGYKNAVEAPEEIQTGGNGYMFSVGTVQYGSTGNDVKLLQQLLCYHGYGLAVDGEFGSITKSAVMEYQKKNGLAMDGIVGPKTWKSLLLRHSRSESELGKARRRVRKI